MTAAEASEHLQRLLNELDRETSSAVTEVAREFAVELTARLEVVERLVDDVYFGNEPDQRSLEDARSNLHDLSLTSARLPSECAGAVPSSRLDHLRALAIDLKHS